MNSSIIKAMTSIRRTEIENLCSKYNLEYKQASKVCSHLMLNTKCGILESVSRFSMLLKDGWTLEYIQNE